MVLFWRKLAIANTQIPTQPYTSYAIAWWFGESFQGKRVDISANDRGERSDLKIKCQGNFAKISYFSYITSEMSVLKVKFGKYD